MTRNRDVSVGRRTLLAAVSGAGLATTAGCTGLLSSSASVDTSSPSDLSESWIGLYALRSNNPDAWLDTIEPEVHSRSAYLDGIDSALDFYRSREAEVEVEIDAVSVAARGLSATQINALPLINGVEGGSVSALSESETAVVDGTYRLGNATSGQDFQGRTNDVRHFLATEDGGWQFVDLVEVDTEQMVRR